MKRLLETSVKDIREAKTKRMRVNIKIRRAGKSDERKAEKRVREIETRKVKLQQLLDEGAKDARVEGKKCSHCKKVYRVEDLNYTLLENETYCRYISRKSSRHVNVICWATRCVKCYCIYDGNRYKTRSASFDAHQTKTLRTHRNGTEASRRELMLALRKVSQGMCAACSIPLVRQGMAGWTQESVNDMNPKQRKVDEETPLDELTMVCLACNYAQNKMDWSEFQEMLRTIASGTPDRANTNTLSQKDISYLELGVKECSVRMKQEIIAKSGRYCHLTGIEVVFESNKWNSISFDRDDSSKPYSVEQTHVCCKHINFVKKGTITEAQTREWVANIRSNILFPAGVFLPKTSVSDPVGGT